jgi:hypothetical protein
LRRLAAGAALALLVGAGTSYAADFHPSPGIGTAPSARPAAGPENTAAAGGRPVSGKNPSAGPQFTKKDGVWSVVTSRVVLRNTVTDPDGDKADLTFEVWTTDANGNPKDQVKLTDANSYGVLVSDFVASGKTAQVTVDYRKLKPGVTYTFRTSAYDGGLYETSWSPWADFRIDPYVTFPAPQASSTIDSTKQDVIPITRTDPGNVAAGLRAGPKRNCSTADTEGRRLCIEINPPSEDSDRSSPSLRAPLGDDLVSWCGAKDSGKDYMNRTEACLKNIGSATLIFLDSDPELPSLGTATFDLQQQMKLYTKKGDSGSDLGEFDQQLVVIPTHIDEALEGVNLNWYATNNCDACSTSPIKWRDINQNETTAHWTPDQANPFGERWGTIQTAWSGTGKEIIDLGWSIRATVDASATVSATADFGTSGDTRVRELAPRCDNILKGVAPGCAFPYFKPIYTVDTNLYPAAGAYYWLMQEKMTSHPGSKKWDSLLHRLGPDTTVKRPSDGQPWTTKDSRDKICPSSWSPHLADASLGALSCDEYAMASTHESGGFPGGPNQVGSGNDCAQLTADKMGTGTSFGLLADTRVATAGPSWEKCGRASIPTAQNTEAFKNLNPALWRLLDDDGFFVRTPGFEHCANANTTCAWKKVG